MFTRRQAIRWAELWLSCWNDGDVDTLLALYRDDARFSDLTIEGDRQTAPVDRREALRRHWAGVACGIHSAPAELEQVIWDPDSRELAIVYAASLGGTRVRGCDLVTLDADDRVVAGEPCVGSLCDWVPAHGTSSADQLAVHEAGGR
jgi:hypothetical protein